MNNKIELDPRSRMERFLSFSPDLHCTLGFDASVVWANDRFRKVFDADGGLVGCAFSQLLHEDDVPLVTWELNALANGRPTGAFTARCRTGAGITGPVDWQVSTDATEKLLYVSGRTVACSNNPELNVEESLRALAATSNLLDTMLDNSPDYIYFKDLQSRFVRHSKSMLSLLNLSDANALKGKTDFDFFLKEHAQPAYDDEQEIIRTGIPIIGKHEKETHPDGRVTWALTTKVPWRDEKGNIIGTFGISKDVTASKETEMQLEQANIRIVETSRLAGMAEVATSVLHNVGNVLNSVNVSSSIVKETLHNSKLPGLKKAVSLMTEHSAEIGNYLTNDVRGRQLPVFLGELANELTEEREMLLQEINSLEKNIAHIKEIVAMQQSYAKVAGVVERIKLSDLIEDALRINAGALVRHDIQVVRDFTSDLPEITVEKHKVLQILVNLIRNAKYACDESSHSGKKMTIAASATKDRVKIMVVDNGIGIPKENLNKIFNHGFTTRKHGHGFGLHSGALSASELGGSLSAQSEGLGKGATFILELPVAPENKDKPCLPSTK